MVIMIKEILKKKVNSTKILLFFCFGITFSACYYAFLIQDYYETYIPQLIEANDRKELEIIQLKENLIEKSNISTEVDIKENTSRGKLFWGVVVGLLVVGGVAVIYCLSGSSFDFFGGFGFTKDDNVSINELTIVNENFQYLKEETLKTREICAQLNKDVKENREDFFTCLEQLTKVSQTRFGETQDLVRSFGESQSQQFEHLTEVSQKKFGETQNLVRSLKESQSQQFNTVRGHNLELAQANYNGIIEIHKVMSDNNEMLRTVRNGTGSVSTQLTDLKEFVTQSVITQSENKALSEQGISVLKEIFAEQKSEGQNTKEMFDNIISILQSIIKK